MSGTRMSAQCEQARDTQMLTAKAWRTRLQAGQATLRAAFEQSGSTANLLRQHCKLVDQLLRDIWQQSGMQADLCLIAVGGYGRGELFPYSDVDLLILLPDDADDRVNLALENLIGLLWDVGLAVGHSVRSLNECVEEARKDPTVQTNMLEARLLCGKAGRYRQFCAATQAEPQPFFAAKMLEQQQRHARFNDTAYNLEPNIKESPGGLRDLQTILWIARSQNLGASWGALVAHGLISKQEGSLIRRHERYLQMLRIRLHYLANRREDRLVFDFQNDMARALGHVTSKRRRASEQLMYQFYRSAKFVILINEILLQLLHERLNPKQHEMRVINDHFQSHNGLLELRSDSLLQRRPAAILECFLLLQHPGVTGFSASLLRTLHRVKNLVNREFRQQAEHKALFLQILQQPSGVTHALTLMNRYGILGRYIPAFGRIIGQMQHDLFHVYTVDEHILNVLCNLRRYVMPEFAHEFPLCSQLFSQFDAPHLLYLGALFHDIAKGRGGDHSTLGAVDARRFCRLHGLSRDDSELVAWLVEMHLVMSSVAQKSDLSDPAIVEGFARRMGSERRLVALYLLTVADIRGTSPKVWNAWKAKLLEQLFVAAQRLLRGSQQSLDAEVTARQQKAQSILSHYGVMPAAYQPLWEQLGKSYFLRHDSTEIAWHSRLLLAHLKSSEPIVRARLSPGGDGIQTMIYTLDRDDLFARICGFFERIGYSILEAKVHTTRHGYALDSFLVLNPNDKNVRYRDLLNYIEYELTQRLQATTPVEGPLQGRLSRQVKHMPINSSIDIRGDDSSANHTLDIVVGDRPGLLSQIAHLFLQHDVHLLTAKVNTLGNRAEDTFLITGKNGQRLSNETMALLREELNTRF